MHYELVYVSQVARGMDPRFIADMVRRARVKNRRMNVTGLLVFDGDAFCQQLEGGQLAVLELAEAIERDPRHTGYRVLHEGPLARRRFGSWNMAYGLTPDEEVGSLTVNRSGVHVAEYLQSLAPSLSDFSAG